MREMNMVLLVIDTQKLITNENLYNFDLFVSNVDRSLMLHQNNYILYKSVERTSVSV